MHFCQTTRPITKFGTLTTDEFIHQICSFSFFTAHSGNGTPCVTARFLTLKTEHFFFHFIPPGWTLTVILS